MEFKLMIAKPKGKNIMIRVDVCHVFMICDACMYILYIYVYISFIFDALRNSVSNVCVKGDPNGQEHKATKT